MKLSNLQWKIIEEELKKFKNSYIIYDKGSIFNYEAGAWLYDYITSDSENEPPVEIIITPEEKKELWKQANKGLAIQLWDKERKDKEIDKEVRKAHIIKIYKTLLITHHLNVLADNEQFVDLGLENILNKNAK